MIEEQRRAVERLKASLFGSDPLVRSQYIQDYHREFRSYRSRIGRDELFAACLRSDIVLVGDYHALPSCQSFAAELVEHMAAGCPRVLLFLEMVFGRDQRALDRLLTGEIDDEQFRRSIRYEREWGYPWDGYGRLLAAARRAGVPVIAADAPPRGGLRLIRRRDRHAALRVTQWLLAEPGARAIVLFGESHIARGHLPREVSLQLERAGARRRSMVIVQNVEEIYWKLARDGEDVAEAVRIDAGRFAVFNASPLAKYEAYRQTLLNWSQQRDEAPDYLPSVHHLIGLLVSHLGIDPYRAQSGPGAAHAIPLVDLYPEVATRRDRRRPRTGRPSAAGMRRARLGVVYRQAPNRVDVYSFSIAAAAAAAARFLLAAFGGTVGRPARTTPAARERGATARARGHREPTRLLDTTTRLLQQAFVGFAVHYLDPGIPSGRSRPRGGAGIGRAEDVSTTDLRALGTALSVRGAGWAGLHPHAGRAKTSLARGAELRDQTGQALGEAIYGGLRRHGRSAEGKRWLLAVARLAAFRSANAGEGRPAGSPRSEEGRGRSDRQLVARRRSGESGQIAFHGSTRPAGAASGASYDPDAAKLGRLLLEGMMLAGWVKRKKPRGGAP